MKYVSSHPMIITPRLMPGIKIADAVISIEASEVRRDSPATISRLYWRYILDIPGIDTYDDAGLSEPWYGANPGGFHARRMLVTLLSFLNAEAERYKSSVLHDTEEPDSVWLFSPAIAAWAYTNSTEIEQAILELGEHDGE